MSQGNRMAEIEYFYSAHSAFAYMGSARFMEISRAANRRIAHRPMDLRKVVAVTGPGPAPAGSWFRGRGVILWTTQSFHCRIFT